MVFIADSISAITYGQNKLHLFGFSEIQVHKLL